MGSNRGSAAMRRLRAAGDRELPDARLPAEKRSALKDTAYDLAERHGPEELMFLAGALEHQAKLKASR